MTIDPCEGCRWSIICCATVVLLDSVQVCQFYNRTTNRCSIYNKRFAINGFCQSVQRAMITKSLPPDCPYWDVIEGSTIKDEVTQREKWGQKRWIKTTVHHDTS